MSQPSRRLDLNQLRPEQLESVTIIVDEAGFDYMVETSAEMNCLDVVKTDGSFHDSFLDLLDGADSGLEPATMPETVWDTGVSIGSLKSGTAMRSVWTGHESESVEPLQFAVADIGVYRSIAVAMMMVDVQQQGQQAWVERFRQPHTKPEAGRIRVKKGLIFGVDNVF